MRRHPPSGRHPLLQFALVMNFHGTSLGLSILVAQSSVAAMPFTSMAEIILPQSSAEEFHSALPTAARAPHAFPLSESELRNLAKALAPKVDLFQAVWEKDPEAEFFAGTTRDYLYWILGHFKGLENLDASGAAGAKTKQQKITEIKSKLLSLPFIKFNEIVGPESDADIMTKNREALSELRAEDFAIRKLDFISFDRAVPDKAMYRDEINQGFIPSEKIRLSKKGITTDPSFGNGVSDLVTGNLSIQFPDIKTFWKTHYAQKGTNHPLLLALRYVRILAQDYLQRHDSEIPDAQKLGSPMTKEIKTKIKDLIQEALHDANGSFKKFLSNDQGKKWLNASIQKSFRSFTNANAAFELMKELGLLGLIEVYTTEIESVHQYLLKTKRNETGIAKNFKTFGLKPEGLYQDISNYLPNLELYHGTASELAFRNIIYQGVIPSEDGSAGRGLYGVSKKDLEFAKEWSKGKSRQDDLVIALKLKPTTKIVDITQGKGKELFEKWKESKNEEKRKSPSNTQITPSLTVSSTSQSKNQDLYDDFAQAFGIDILRYPYTNEKAQPIEAFVLKNADMIESKRGVFKNPRPLSELLLEAENAKQNDDLSLLKDFLETPLTKVERNKIISILGDQYFIKAMHKDRIHTLKKYMDLQIVSLFELLLASPLTSIRSLIWKQILALLKDTDDYRRWQMTYALKYQSRWPSSVWNKAPTLMKDSNMNIGWQMSWALEKQSTWPPSFWTEVPALLKDQNDVVRQEMTSALEHQSSWPSSVWNEVPALLKDQNEFVRLKMISALEHQSSWPSSVWNEVPSLMKDSNPSIRVKIPSALKHQSSWPISVWNEVPTFMKGSSDVVRVSMGSAIDKQSTWPPSFWTEIPALLAHPNEFFRFTMVLALRNQSLWPISVWNEIPALMKDTCKQLRWQIPLLLKMQSTWPTSFWDEVPALMKDTNEDIRRKMAEALKAQSAWPHNIITLVAESTHAELSELKTLKPSTLDLSSCKNSLSEIPDSKSTNNISGAAKP